MINVTVATEDLDYPTNGVNPELLGEQLLAIGVHVSTNSLGIILHLADIADESNARSIVSAHDSTLLSTDQQLQLDLDVNGSDVDSRFDLSVIKNKTPDQIFTFLEGQIDGWTTLADAQVDLREWLPLLASAVAWKVQKG